MIERERATPHRTPPHDSRTLALRQAVQVRRPSPRACCIRWGMACTWLVAWFVLAPLHPRRRKR